MDGDQLQRLAAIAVGRRFSGDPIIDREDLLQTAAVAIWQKRGSHPGRQVMHARSAIRNLRETLQCRTRREQRQMPDGYGYDTVSATGSHVQEIIERELKDRVLASLSGNHRLTIEETLAGLTVTEIAKKHNLSPTTVRHWVRKTKHEN